MAGFKLSFLRDSLWCEVENADCNNEKDRCMHGGISCQVSDHHRSRLHMWVLAWAFLCNGTGYYKAIRWRKGLKWVIRQGIHATPAKIPRKIGANGPRIGAV